MARLRKTPPLGLRGIYTLELPFTPLPKKLYTCEAIRSFKDIVNMEIDIFDVFYEPYGISYEVFEEDDKLNTHIVTLKSEVDTIHLPDTFITQLPYTGSDDYKVHILGIDLGPLPKSTGLDNVRTTLSDTLTTLLGYEPQVDLFVTDYNDALTEDEILRIEVLRAASLNGNNTNYGLLQAEKKRTLLLEEKIVALQTELIRLKTL